jgi:hypothetical protein
MKVMVSPTLTLEQALYEARELAEHAAAELDVPDPTAPQDAG